MATTQDYINQLKIDKQNLVSMLNSMGVEANDNETFTSLTPKVGKIVTDPILQDKTITITENGTTNIVADEGYDGLNNVDVTVSVEGVESEGIDVYSTNETKTNKIWIDGKPVYRKVIDFGALPNNTKKQVSHGIENLDMIIGFSAVAWGPTATFLLPLASPAGTVSNIYVIESGGHIEIMTGSNRSNFTKCYVTLEYTKTTD